ncbi:MAG: Bug family tripartite tricarboxylate transporter substrate binding protein [Xanthobacteraceae bacterium]
MKRVALALVLLLTAASVASADPIGDFYAGKTLRMLVGYGPGGGYDIYGRLVAEFLPKFLPGHPTIVTENMPGAGSFAAANYIANVAPRDGTVLASLAQTLALDSAVGGSGKTNAADFHYIGRVTTNIDVGIARISSGIKSIDDVRKKQYTVGASGRGSTTDIYAEALNAYGGTKFKIVIGYKGTSEILLAMDRGEVDIDGAYGLPGMLASHPDWIKGGATLLFQAALKRSPLLPNVPTLSELATADEGKAILRAIASTAEIGRSFISGPGVPADRLAALRQAFARMVKDPDFVATCEKRHLMLDPASGEDMDAIVKETFALPKPTLDKIGAMLNSK